MSTDNKPFSVILCDAHPDEEDFDAANTGDDFDTLEEARAIFDAADVAKAMSLTAKDPSRFLMYYSKTPFVWLTGPGVHEVRQLHAYKPAKNDDSEWRREMAMEAGMAFGCDGYNDAMGY